MQNPMQFQLPKVLLGTIWLREITTVDFGRDYQNGHCKEILKKKFTAIKPHDYRGRSAKAD